MEKQKGFTLIELLVVISIIGFLASIVLVNLSSARVKARNVKRNSDIDSLRTAFQANEASLPSTAGGWACVSATCYNGWSAYPANGSVDSFISTYAAQKPTDPNDSTRGYGGFLYISTAGGWQGYDGYVYPVGTYLNWLLEPPLTSPSTVCGPGRLYNYTASYVQCLLKLD